MRAAGTLSGANHQPWHFACVEDPETKRAIRQAAEAESGLSACRRRNLQILAPWAPTLKTLLETAPWLIAISLKRSDGQGNRRKNITFQNPSA